MITRQNSILHAQSKEAEIKRYIEDGVVLAEGEGVLCTIEDYLLKLGYDLNDPEVQEWRISPSYPNYEVSDLGLVRNAKTKRILSPSLKDAYVEGVKSVWRTGVGLVVDGVTVRVKPHRLVAEAFIGEVPDESIVSHKNDIPLDNRLVNLEYVTPAVNVDIRWVLDDLRELNITVNTVDYIYDITKDVVEDNAGVPIDQEELTLVDLLEVREYADVSLSTIVAIYEYKTKGTGLLTRLAVDVNGRYYLPEHTVLVTDDEEEEEV